MDYRKIGWLHLLLLTVLLNFVAQTAHEAGHVAVYEALGRGPVWGFLGLVQIWGSTPPLHPQEWIRTIGPDGDTGWLRLASAPGATEEMIMNAAGPLASLLAVVSGLALVRFSRNRVLKQMALVLALISSMLMSIYYLRAASRMGGDEYFVARQLNVPRHVVDIPFGAAFAICFVLAVRALGDWRTRLKWLGVILVGSVPTGIALMIANGWVRAEVNRSSPFFRPALGFSFPVVLVDAIALLALWIWWGWANTRQGVT